MKIPKIMKVIGTHSGAFHCDEVFACYMLKLLPEYKDAEILRSRKPEELAKCDIVVDVGAVYDPAKHRYDHHQREFSHTLKSVLGLDFNTKLSSAGLVYAHFGKQVIQEIVENNSIEAEKLDILYKKIYERFVEEIDGIDNGIDAMEGTTNYQITTNLSSRIGYLNPKWNEKDAKPDENFKVAMKVVGDEFSDRVKYYYQCWLPARDLVGEAIKSRYDVDKSGQVVSFESCPGVPWKEHLYELEKSLNDAPRLLYVIYPDTTSGDWRIQCIPEGPSNPFASRLPLPELWRGVRDEKLDDVCGIKGSVFCHASGFIGGNKTKEGAIEMVKKALENQSA